MGANVLNDISKSLSTYFKLLTQLGYVKQSDVYKLLVYNFIGELLTEDTKVYISEEDYKSIEQALYCLYGSSCLIPYPLRCNPTC